MTLIFLQPNDFYFYNTRGITSKNVIKLNSSNRTILKFNHSIDLYIGWKHVWIFSFLQTKIIFSTKFNFLIYFALLPH